MKSIGKCKGKNEKSFFKKIIKSKNWPQNIQQKLKNAKSEKCIQKQRETQRKKWKNPKIHQKWKLNEKSLRKKTFETSQKNEKQNQMWKAWFFSSAGACNKSLQSLESQDKRSCIVCMAEAWNEHRGATELRVGKKNDQKQWIGHSSAV